MLFKSSVEESWGSVFYKTFTSNLKRKKAIAETDVLTKGNRMKERSEVETVDSVAYNRG